MGLTGEAANGDEGAAPAVFLKQPMRPSSPRLAVALGPICSAGLHKIPIRLVQDQRDPLFPREVVPRLELRRRQHRPRGIVGRNERDDTARAPRIFFQEAPRVSQVGSEAIGGVTWDVEGREGEEGDVHEVVEVGGDGEQDGRPGRTEGHEAEKEGHVGAGGDGDVRGGHAAPDVLSWVLCSTCACVRGCGPSG